MNPIYVPSKNRPDCATACLLKAEGLDFQIVVEPQDFNAYRQMWKRSRLVVLPEDSQGLPYSRGFIKSHSKKAGEEAHWQIDDDVQEFRMRPMGQPSFKVSARTALELVEKFMAGYENVAVAGPNQNSWPPRGRFFFNDLPVQAVLINNCVESNYRRAFPLMSDFDFILQVLKEGWCTALMDELRVVTPGDHGKPGGLKEVYAANRHRDSALALVKAWPGLGHKVREDGAVTLYKKKFMRRFPQKPRLYSRRTV